MDPVRLGRVLGIGARAAAETVVHAVDAATTPNPSPASPQSRSPRAQDLEALRPTGAANPVRSASPRTPPTRNPPSAYKQAQQAVPKIKTTARGVREGTRRFGREIWNPFVRLSGVLWLEVTGVFFGIFALFALGAVWRLRTAWHVTSENAAEHHRLLGAIAMLCVFGYFCVSSFVRARRRQLGR
ncbi:MAG: hypothetical protein NVSMB62_04070 [Acidobacteriaceae bacterium]